VSIQFIVRDPFAAVELIDAAPDLRVDRVPVFQKPTILFLLGFQQTEQYFLKPARAGRLKLFLDSGLQAASLISMFTAQSSGMDRILSSS